MKRSKFLIKLKKEGKLDIVEPSDNLTESYLNKSESHLESAKILFSSGKLEECVSMAYYGMYHCLLGLLFKCGIKSENHTASILLLEHLFEEGKLSKEIRFAKKERIDKQYYTDFELTKMDCGDMIKKAENFVVGVKLIMKNLNKGETDQLRNNLSHVLNEREK